MSNKRGKRQEMEPVDEAMINENEEVVTGTAEGVVTNCFDLNVRKEPSKSADVLTIIRVGTTVEILDDSNVDWYQVRINPYTIGFCMKEFIDKK